MRIFKQAIFWGLVLGAVCGVRVANAAITATFTPARTTGVAPLAVFFDATATTHSTASLSTYHDLTYEWDFGDTSAGSWAVSGASKNRAIGPVAAHVFERAGTYTVTLKVRDGLAGTNPVTVVRNIEVTDPNTVFAGSNTICFSTSGNFTDCPTGAQRVTTSSFAASDAGVMSYAASGRRLLLRRGETFSANSMVSLRANGPGLVGAFGSAGSAKPRINVASGGGLSFSSRDIHVGDWRVMDLNFVGTGSGTLLGYGGPTRQLLFQRVDAASFSVIASLESSVIEYYWNQGYTNMRFHEDLAFAECNFASTSQANGFLASNRLMMLGNDWKGSTTSHVLRIAHAQGAVLAHNRFADTQNAEKHVFKLHSGFFDAGYITAGQYSERIVISDNTFRGTASQLVVSMGPQYAGANERHRRVLLERNHFVAGPGTFTLLTIYTSDFSVRNNIFDQSGGSQAKGIDLTAQRGPESPHDNRIVHNTCYSRTTPFGVCLQIRSDVLNTLAWNNLQVAPGISTSASPVYNSGSGTNLRCNLASPTPGFVVASPVLPADFQLQRTSGLINRCAYVATSLLDFGGKDRVKGSSPTETQYVDVGAHEHAPFAPPAIVTP